MNYCNYFHKIAGGSTAEWGGRLGQTKTPSLGLKMNRNAALPRIRTSEEAPARRRFVSKSGAAPRSIQITPAYIWFLCQKNNQYGSGQRCNGGFASVCHVKLVYQVSGIHSRAVGVPDNRGLIGMEKIWSPNARLINKRTNR